MAASFYDNVESILKSVPPPHWSQTPSAYYVYLILKLVSDASTNDYAYFRIMDVVMAFLNKPGNKNLINDSDLKLLFLFLIKKNFLQQRPFKKVGYNPDKEIADQMVVYYRKHEGDYHLTDQDVKQQYYDVFPPALTKQQVNKMRSDVDELMLMITVSTYNHLTVFPDEPSKQLFYLDKIIEDKFDQMLPIILHYGYKKYIRDFQFGLDMVEVISNWLTENPPSIWSDKAKNEAWTIVQDHNNKQLVLAQLSDGSLYQGPKGGIPLAEERIYKQRALQTLENITGGIFGALGYAINGDKGSDIGAICDNLFVAAGQAYVQAQQWKKVEPQRNPIKPQANEYRISEGDLREARRVDTPAGIESGYMNPSGLATPKPVVEGNAKGTMYRMTDGKGIIYNPISMQVPQYVEVVPGAYYYQADKANSSQYWSLRGDKRGIAIENELARTQYKDWDNVGQYNSGYFPGIDFAKGKEVVSLKTLDPTIKGLDNALDQLGSNVYEISVAKFPSLGKNVKRYLDLRVPRETPDNMKTFLKEALSNYIPEGLESRVTVIVSEF